MIDTKLIDLLLDEISDEAAHHIVNFLYDLALVVESLYLGQIVRYSRERKPLPESPAYLKKKANPDNTF